MVYWSWPSAPCVPCLSLTPWPNAHRLYFITVQAPDGLEAVQTFRAHDVLGICLVRSIITRLPAAVRLLLDCRPATRVRTLVRATIRQREAPRISRDCFCRAKWSSYEAWTAGRLTVSSSSAAHRHRDIDEKLG